MMKKNYIKKIKFKKNVSNNIKLKKFNVFVLPNASPIKRHDVYARRPSLLET